MNSIKTITIFDFVYLLFFLPSITFNLLPAEIFPWGILLLFSNKKRFNKSIIIIILFLVCLVFLSLLLQIDMTDIFRSSVAYFNILFFINYLLISDQSTILKISKIVFPLIIFLLILGMLQFLGLVKFLDPLFKFLITRGSSESFESGGRGVNLLTTEPSRAGVELVYMYFFSRIFLVNNKKRVIFDFLIVLFLLFIIRSATSLFILLLGLLFDYRKKMPFLVFIGTIVIIVLSLIISRNDNLRLIRVVSVIIDMFSQLSFKDLTLYLVNASGFRIISILGAYFFGLLHPFGGLVGNWQKTSVEGLYLTGFSPSEIYFFRELFNSQFIPVRPTSFCANIMIDFGLFGFIFVFVFIFILVKKYKLTYSSNKKTILFLFLFSILLYGEAGHPIIWILFFTAGKLQDNTIKSSIALNKISN